VRQFANQNEPPSGGLLMLATRFSVRWRTIERSANSGLQPASRSGFSHRRIGPRSIVVRAHPLLANRLASPASLTVFFHSHRGISALSPARAASPCLVDDPASRRPKSGTRKSRRTSDALGDWRPRLAAPARAWPLHSASPRNSRPTDAPWAHPSVQERTRQHEKRNAHQCLAAGGMPDRDH